MSKLIRTVLIGIAPIVLLGVGAQAYAQDDVDCFQCVDTKDIGSRAITTGKIAKQAVTANKIAKQAVNASKLAKDAVVTNKIADGAVTVNKVVPKLKNAIGTVCLEGEFVIGMDENGNFVCESFASFVWTVSDFLIGGTNVVNDCAGGAKYIKKSGFDPALFVGAQRCSQSRYKLFLATSAEGTYFEIADQTGQGQDHCELIGGTDTTAIGTQTISPPLPSGFWRSVAGEPFQFSTPPPDNAWRSDWYECGISIP